MKKLIFAMMAAGTALAAVGPAEASQGCGPGGHRSYECRPNRPYAYGPGPIVVGSYYPHHVWWDDHRYWAHHDRWHGGWRYR
jgi:hypothetical protein